MITREKKRALIADASEKGCTLDGCAAGISGASGEFGTVWRRDGKGGDVVFSWPTIARILAGSRAFKS